MPDITADPPDPSCLLSSTGIVENQGVGPDPFSPRARDALGRFAKGSSGNPRGRPRGIRNPKRRVPDLVTRPLGAQALSDLLDRKPHLLRPLAVQLLPPPLSDRDPAERVGIEDCWPVLSTVLTAIARGEIAPGEGARIARRVRARLRTLRRLARLQRRLPHETRPVTEGVDRLASSTNRGSLRRSRTARPDDRGCGRAHRESI
jgi:Family of unknown function (DUF5681)